MKTCQFAAVVRNIFFAVIMVILFPLVLCAAAAELPKIDLDFSKAAIKGGEEIFKSTCQTCHSLKYSGYKARMSEEAAQSAFGRVPPDLSLMAKARGRGSKGAGYIYALLVSFNDTPEKNSVFPNIAMPPVLSKDDPELARKAKEVSAFLYDAAEPSENERMGLGGYVLGYMVLLATLLYFLNRKTWKGMKNKPS
jgi:cytochrome c1